MNISGNRKRSLPTAWANPPERFNKTGKYHNRTLTALPTDIVVKILGYLDGHDLLLCKRVSRRWKAIIDTDPALACAFYRRCHPPDPQSRAEQTLATAKSRYVSIRPWLKGFSSEGDKAVIRLDKILANGGRYFPERLFFAVANVLDEAKTYTCKKVCTIKNAEAVIDVRFSPNEQHFVTTCCDHTVNVYRCIDGWWQEIATLPQSSNVFHVGFSPDSQYLIAVCKNDTGEIWSWQGEYWQKNASLTQVSCWGDPRFSADSKHLVTVSRDSTAQIYGLIGAQWQPLATALVNQSITCARFHPSDHRLLATCHTGRDHVVNTWLLSNGLWQPGDRLVHSPQSEVYRFQFSPDGNYLATNMTEYASPTRFTNTTYLWQRVDQQWRQVTLLPQVFDAINTSFSANGDHLITFTGGGHNIQLWFANRQQWIGVSLPRSQYFSSGRLSTNGLHCVAESYNHRAHVWSFFDQQWQKQAVLPRVGWLNKISFSPHGNHLITTGTERTAHIWRYTGRTWQKKAALFHPGQVYRACFSPSGYFVVTRTKDNAVHIWTFRQGQL